MTDLLPQPDSGRAAGPPRCLGCDYDLSRLTTPRCPECGRAFDPRDPASFHGGRPMPDWARWWLRPIGWPTFVITAVLALAASPLLTDPATYYLFIPFCVFAPATLFAVGWSLFRLFVRESLVTRYGRRAPTAAGGWRRWLALGALVAAVQLSAVFALPLRASFVPFAGQYERLRQDVEAGRVAPLTPVRIGGRTVCGEGSLAGYAGLFVVYTDCAAGQRPNVFPASGSGFLHVPDGTPFPGYNQGGDGHLWGNWYYFTTD